MMKMIFTVLAWTNIQMASSLEVQVNSSKQNLPKLMPTLKNMFKQLDPNHNSTSNATAPEDLAKKEDKFIDPMKQLKSAAYAAVGRNPPEQVEIPPMPPRRDNPQGLTLRQWILKQNCLNAAAQPLLNTQFGLLGAMDALYDAGVQHKITGLSGVSSGAFVMSLAGSKDYRNKSREFRRIWPGWAAFGGKDPEMSANYKKDVLSKTLPETFEELRVPTAVAAVVYKDDKAAHDVDNQRADPMVISDGGLYDAVTVSSSALIGPGCPKCKAGWSAKEYRGKWPVSDGFLKDEYGTLGLTALKPCPNLLHFQPQMYYQQIYPTKNRDLDSRPSNVVTLGIDLPQSSIQAMTTDFVEKYVQKVAAGWKFPEKVHHAKDWESRVYGVAYNHTLEMLDKPMQIQDGDDETHYFVDLNNQKDLRPFQSQFEAAYWQPIEQEHTKYWIRTIPRRDKMVKLRNDAIAEGKLSYKRCGNGFGSPKCNMPVR